MFNNDLHPFGLDIGDESIKVARFKKRKNFKGKDEIILDTFGEKRLLGNIIKDGEIKDISKLAQAISELLIQTNIKSKYTVVALPEKKAFLKLLEIKARNEKNLIEGIPKILESHLPVPYKDIYLDWEIISKKTDKDGMVEYKVLIAAAIRKTVDIFTELLESINLIPLAIEMEGLAIARGAFRPKPNTKQYSNKLIIDIGSTSSNLIFIQNNIPSLSLNMSVSGNEMTNIIEKSLKLSKEKAEKTKIKCGLDLNLCDGKLRPVLLSIIDNIVKKTKQSLNFCKNSFGQEQVNEIYLSGGGSNLKKLDAVLSQKLKIKVRKCNPLENIKINNQNFQKDAVRYTTAIGLAIRSIIYPYP